MRVHAANAYRTPAIVAHVLQTTQRSHLHQHHAQISPTKPPRETLLTRKCAQVHKLCQEAAQQILDEFKPNLMIAIGGGGYVPARILRYYHPSSTNNL